MIFEEREHQWLDRLERPLAKLGKAGKVGMLSVCIALIVLLLTAITFATDAHTSTGHADKSATVLSGAAGLITYLVVGGLSGCWAPEVDFGPACLPPAADLSMNRSVAEQPPPSWQRGHAQAAKRAGLH